MIKIKEGEGFRPCPICGCTDLRFSQDEINGIESVTDENMVCERCGFIGPQLNSKRFRENAIAALNRITIAKWNRGKSTDHIEPCPVCGSKSARLNNDDLVCHMVICDECGCMGPSESYDDIVELLMDCWNNTL